MKLLLYCTKTKPYLYHDEDYCFDTMNTIDLGYKTFEYTNQRVYDDETGKFLGWEKYGNMWKNDPLNGKIVAECDFEIEQYLIGKVPFGHSVEVINKHICEGVATYSNTDKMLEDILNNSCLNIKELTNYMRIREDIIEQKDLYAIRIKNLHIFDKPRELSEYYKLDNTITLRESINRTKPVYIPINKAPQSMMYCFEDDGNHLRQNILISIKPEWLCKILNGKKTIEVRKKVLKEMLGNA